MDVREVRSSNLADADEPWEASRTGDWDMAQTALGEACRMRRGSGHPLLKHRAGTATHRDEGKVGGMVSQEKWDKTKRLVAEMEKMVAWDRLPLTRLLQIRGFLMYVVHKYP